MRTQHYNFAYRNIETADIKKAGGVFASMQTLVARLWNIRSRYGYGSRAHSYYIRNF